MTRFLQSDAPGTMELQQTKDEMESQQRDNKDAIVLRQVGKKPVLKVRPIKSQTDCFDSSYEQRNFNLLSMFGFSCLVLGTWQGLFMYVCAHIAALRNEQLKRS